MKIKKATSTVIGTSGLEGKGKTRLRSTWTLDSDSATVIVGPMIQAFKKSWEEEGAVKATRITISIVL